MGFRNRLTKLRKFTQIIVSIIKELRSTKYYEKSEYFEYFTYFYTIPQKFAILMNNLTSTLTKTVRTKRRIKV